MGVDGGASKVLLFMVAAHGSNDRRWSEERNRQCEKERKVASGGKKKE